MKTLTLSFSPPTYTYPQPSLPFHISLSQKSSPQFAINKTEPRRKVHTGVLGDGSLHNTHVHQSVLESECLDKRVGKKRVFFLDVNPLCYDGNTPSLFSFARWLSLFLSQVSLNHPVIAVISPSIYSYSFVIKHAN